MQMPGKNVRSISYIRFASLVTLVLLGLSACLIAPQTANLAATSTPSAPTVLPATQTPLPSDTPQPTSRATSTATATVHPSPTASSTPTQAAQAIINPQNVANLTPGTPVTFKEGQSFSWLSDGRSLAVVEPDQLELYVLNAGKQSPSVPVSGVSQLVFAPDGLHYAASTQQNQILLGTLGPSEPQVLTGHKDGITSLAFSPDSTQLASSGFDKSLIIWDVESAKKQNSVALNYWLADLSFSPQGDQLAGADLENFTVHIYDFPQLKESKTLQWSEHASPALYGAVFSPDWLGLAWYARGTVQLQEVVSGNFGASLDHEDFISSISWSPDGRLLATTSAATVNDQFSPVVSLWDVVKGEVANQLVLPDPANEVAFSPDGQTLAVLLSTGDLQTWAVK